MFVELNIILCGLCIGFNSILLILNYQNYTKHYTKLDKFAVVLQVFIVAMLISLLTYLIIPVEIFYQIIIIIGVSAFTLTCYGFFQMIALGGGGRPKIEKIIFMGYIIAASIFAIVFFLANLEEQPVEGNYLGLDLTNLIIPALIFLVPILYLGIIAIKHFLQLYEEHLRYPLIAYLAALLYYLVSLFVVICFAETKYISLSFLLGAIGVGIYLNRKYPELLVHIGSSFAYKNLYILRNNGQTIYTHEFEPSQELKDDKMIRYLIGGFLYAISHGIKEIIKTEYDTILRTMDFGRLKMLFYYGNHVFGLLFTRESNQILFNKLKNFIDNFELDLEDFILDSMSVNLLENQSLDEKNKAALLKIENLVTKHFRR